MLFVFLLSILMCVCSCSNILKLLNGRVYILYESIHSVLFEFVTKLSQLWVTDFNKINTLNTNKI